jgi:hypothetical protein
MGTRDAAAPHPTCPDDSSADDADDADEKARDTLHESCLIIYCIFRYLRHLRTIRTHSSASWPPLTIHAPREGIERLISSADDADEKARDELHESCLILYFISRYLRHLRHLRTIRTHSSASWPPLTIHAPREEIERLIG